MWNGQKNNNKTSEAMINDTFGVIYDTLCVKNVFWFDRIDRLLDEPKAR